MSITACEAVAKNVAQGRNWSVYLREVGRPDENGTPSRYALVMPDEDGVLPDAVRMKRTGIVVSWPVNPHNSGEAVILDRLNDTEARKLFMCPVVANGFEADQDGRHHKIQ